MEAVVLGQLTLPDHLQIEATQRGADRWSGKNATFSAVLKDAQPSPRPTATLTKTFANRLAEVFSIMGSYEYTNCANFTNIPMLTNR